MKSATIALFGESEKGDYETAYYCRTLPELVEYLGNPPPNTRGLYYAVQAILYHYNLMFFRVREEGFSYKDYFIGFNLLETHREKIEIIALCLPGVGDSTILNRATPFCLTHRSIIVTNEPDFYDLMTREG